jgi:sugar-specific transcriptional regulator TrmB
LGKYGPKTAPEVFRVLGLPRTEAYSILNALQSRGIVSAECSFPTRYMALPIKQALATLINAEKEKINILTQQQNQIIQLWDDLPSCAIETGEVETERLQMMEGSGVVYSKIKSMIKSAREQICIVGSEQDLGKFYHSDIIKTISNSGANTKIILTPATKIPDFLKRIDKKKIKISLAEKNISRCYVVKDNDEVILFLRNASHHADSIFAIWSNSKSLIDSIGQLFEYSWKNANGPLAEVVS